MLRAEILKELTPERIPSSLAQAIEHSRKIDLKLGLNKRELEAEIQTTHPIQTGTQAWIGLSPDALETTYAEFVHLVTEFSSKLSPQGAPPKHFIDLGAAYGRLGIVLGLLQPETHFTGFELISERVAAARLIYQKLGLDPNQMVQQDLTAPKFHIPAADFYFIYDFGTKDACGIALTQLKQIATEQPITVFARGRGIRNWIDRDHPWLSQVVTPIHRSNLSIYRSA